MKQQINVEDIKKGDLIQEERPKEFGAIFSAVEFTAGSDGEHFFEEDDTTHYLLDRPEPPFEPYWGMVIGDPHLCNRRAVYLPDAETDNWPWLTYESGWVTDEWVKKKLAGVWVVIEKPEGVK